MTSLLSTRGFLGASYYFKLLVVKVNRRNGMIKPFDHEYARGLLSHNKSTNPSEIRPDVELASSIERT